MTSTILNCQSFVPPLLEGQLTPSYHIVKRLLDYLQEWREYLFMVFRKDFGDVEPLIIQSKVDEFIKTLMLVYIVHKYDETALPRFEDLLLQCSAGRDFYAVLSDNIRDGVLSSLFEPEGNSLPYWKELCGLSAISKSIDALGISQLPVSIIGNFHQLCLDIPVADIAVSKKLANRHRRGVYYTPSPLVDYLVYYSFEDAFGGEAVDQILNAKILDPSCGCGIFIIAALRYILERLRGRPCYAPGFSLQTHFSAASG